MTASTVARVCLASPNYSLPQYEAVNTSTLTLKTPTFTGGDWWTTLPLSNLASEYLYNVARSISAALVKTTFTADLQVQRPISVVGAIGHNLTPALGDSRWRVRLGTTNSFPANLLSSPDALGAVAWSSAVSVSTSNVATYGGRSFSRIANPHLGNVIQAVTLTTNGVKYLSCEIHRDIVDGIGHILVYDTVEDVSRGDLQYTIVADGTVTAVASTGTLVSSAYLGNGRYWFLLATTSCIAVNAHTVYACDSGGTTITSVLLSRLTLEEIGLPPNLLTSPNALGTAPWASDVSVSTSAAATYGGQSFSRIANPHLGNVVQVVTLTGDGVKYLSCEIHRDGVDGVGHVLLYDTTAGVSRGDLQYTVAATGVVTAIAAKGTLVDSAYHGNGRYWFLLATNACTASNIHAVYACDSGGTTITSVLMSAFALRDAATNVVMDSQWRNVFTPAYDPTAFPTGYTAVNHAAAPSIAELQNYPSRAVAYVNDAIVFGRYLKVEFDDTANTAGYVQLAGLFAGPGFTPNVQVAVGFSIGHRDPSGVVTGETSSTRFYKRSRRARVATMVLPFMAPEQGFGWPFEMGAQLGITEQLFFVMDPTATTGTHRTMFLATMEELSALEHPYMYDLTSMPIKLIEVL